MAKFSLIDSPIECCADDSLEISSYVDAMHSFIKGCDTPLTIGIQGDWGIGKTSFLNMLRDKFSYTKGREVRCHTIYFNTWKYSQFKQEEMLSLSILREIVSNINKLASENGKGDREKITSGAKKFGLFVTNLGSQVIKAQTGLDLNAANQAIKEKEVTDLVSLIKDAKTQFEELVQSLIQSGLTDKLIIIIDDLDRLKPIRALEFLEAVKNFLDVSGCVFLIAIDYSIIQKGMEEKLGRSAREMQGKSYYDKIIQVPFNMPTGAYKTDAYVMAMLGWERSGETYHRKDAGEPYLRIGKTIPSQNDADFFVNITRLTVGSNPRSIKRSISYATLLKIILLQSESIGRFDMRSAKVLYALASLQLTWPEVFAILAENPVKETVSRLQDFDYLESSTQLDHLFHRVYNPDEVKSNITAFFDELLAAIDTNDDGGISNSEFKIIPKIMKQANMMATELENLDDMWNHFRKMITQATKTKSISAEIDRALRLFQGDHSSWNNALHLRLIPAGKRFVNVLWAKRQIGSLVTTKKEPLQFYLRCNPDDLTSSHIDLKEFVIDVRNVGHYGIGESKIELLKIGSAKNGNEILNLIHTLALNTNKARRERNDGFLQV